MTRDISLSEKYTRLVERLRSFDSLAIAYSGGVDSVFLLKAAAETLSPGNVLAITVRADNFPAREFAEAKEYAARFGVRHVVKDFDLWSVPGFVENSPERCYHCKHALFTGILAEAGTHGIATVADGGNLDDGDDYRPGMRAVRELGIVSPLAEAGLHKADIRELLREAGIPLWNKPAFACLASRIPYGTEISRKALRQIDQAENYFLSLGFANVRVRKHDNVARIELESEERDRFCKEGLWDQTAEALAGFGFTYSALDLRGYRMGSLNTGLL